MNRLFCKVILAGACLLGASQSALAQYQELDAIVAVVEDDVVLASELVERLDMVREQFSEANQPLPPNDILMSQIMERLILESLQVQEAERRGVVVDDETLTRAVGTFAANNNMTLSSLLSGWPRTVGTMRSSGSRSAGRCSCSACSRRW